jgi:hypothetical protein
MVDGIGFITPDANNRVCAHTQAEPTTHTTVGAGGSYFPGGILDPLGDKGSYRTALNTFAAGDADRILEGFVAEGAYFQIVTPIRHINGINSHDFAARSNAYAAVNALIRIEIKEGVARIQGEVSGHAVETIEPLFIKTDAVDQLLKTACTALWTQKAIEVVVTQQKFKGYPPYLFDFCIIRGYHHSRLNRGSACRMKLFLLLDLDQAYTAGPFWGEPWTMAQCGDVDP